MQLRSRIEFRNPLFDYPSKEFVKHLSYADNNRILFSGKFGIGKSFFLDYFFKEDVQVRTMADVRYKAFHMFPVNYSIASNEDIFSYIKYDVITSMLLSNIELSEYDFNFLQTAPLYLKDHWIKTLAKLVSVVPKIGKPIQDAFDRIEEVRKDFIEKQKSYKEPEASPLLQHLQKLEQKEGSIFENDIITQLIANILQRLKKDTGHENVLIIDDLDRIDPEHIFRLLNVFAAHLDSYSSEPNKLGFDKIIFVCDINNLRNIFRAKYGSETDFNGYIDKFYSYDVYHFDNRKVLRDIAYEVFKNVEFLGVQTDNSLHHYDLLFFKRTNLALELLVIFISYGMISLRNLVTRLVRQIEIDPNRGVTFDLSETVSQMNNPLLVQFNILRQIVGEYDVIRDFIVKIPEKGFQVSDINAYCNQLLYFLNYQKTFRTTGGTPTVEADGGVILYMKLPNNVAKGLDDIMTYGLGDGHTSPNQYSFSMRQFKMLLEEFAEMLIRIEN
jgi:hypothetical protein